MAAARFLLEALDAAGLGAAFIPGEGPGNLWSARFENNVFTTDPVRFARIAKLVEAAPHLGLGGPTIGWAHAAFRIRNRFDEPNFPRRLETPILIIGSGADQVIDTAAAERFAIRRSGRIIVIDGAQHEILIERDGFRRQFWAAFDKFVPGSAARAAAIRFRGVTRGCGGRRRRDRHPRRLSCRQAHFRLRARTGSTELYACDRVPWTFPTSTIRLCTSGSSISPRATRRRAWRASAVDRPVRRDRMDSLSPDPRSPSVTDPRSNFSIGVGCATACAPEPPAFVLSTRWSDAGKSRSRSVQPCLLLCSPRPPRSGFCEGGQELLTATTS